MIVSFSARNVHEESKMGEQAWEGLTLSTFLRKVSKGRDNLSDNIRGEESVGLPVNSIGIGEKNGRIDTDQQRLERQRDWCKSKKMHKCTHAGCDKVSSSHFYQKHFVIIYITGVYQKQSSESPCKNTHRRKAISM